MPEPAYIDRDITICLHCGEHDHAERVIKTQTDALEPLKEEFNVHWNNRIDRHPGAYDSYAELVNEAVATSPTETIILMNDRVVPKASEVRLILQLMHHGYAAASQWNVAFLGVTKELFRTIGWFDQRYYGGGCEDDDFVLRLRLANLAYYESLTCEYDQSWKSPLFKSEGAKCAISGPYFHRKWVRNHEEIKRVIPEENYPHWDALAGPRRHDISSRWKTWDHSIVGIDFGRRETDGDSRTYHFTAPDYRTEFRRVTSA